jgi:hypothetical protein
MLSLKCEFPGTGVKVNKKRPKVQVGKATPNASQARNMQTAKGVRKISAKKGQQTKRKNTAMAAGRRLGARLRAQG